MFMDIHYHDECGSFFFGKLLDLFFSPGQKRPEFPTVSCPKRWERDLPYTIKIEVENYSNAHFHLAFVDDLPQTFRRPFPCKWE